MVESELFLSSAKQVLEWRMVQDRYWNHKPLSLDLSHIDCNVASGNIRLVSGLKFEKLLGIGNHRWHTYNTHDVIGVFDWYIELVEACGSWVLWSLKALGFSGVCIYTDNQRETDGSDVRKLAAGDAERAYFHMALLR
jgi:hypothetical protein